MRLLSLDSSGKLALTEFPHDIAPPYAILSHTWRADGDEVTFKDLSQGLATSRPGYAKISFCSEKAANHGLKYFWVDTCCIDKSSSAELQESITSMFRWYQNSARCYVYLSDVSIADNELSNQPSQSSWQSSFRASRWFTRGWTLQELIAPTSVEFYSREGKRLVTRSLSSGSTDERLLWAQNRSTTRGEDWAYSLLGIFDVVIPLLYGEGREKAVMRLKREIYEATNGPKQLNGTTPSVVDVFYGTEGATAQDVQTHDSMRSWIGSFQSGSATGFSNVKQLVSKKGPLRDPSEELMTHRLPRNQTVFARQQPVPPKLRQFVKRSIDSDQAHLIIHGLGPSGGETRDKMFPRSATINAIHEYLDQEGFDPICAFQVNTGRGSYVVERSVPKSAITAVEVTDDPSCYYIQNGYQINADERLVDFYNSRFSGEAQVAVVAHPDYIEVQDKHVIQHRIYVDFKRTVRVPDDDQTYELPPPLASFPLLLSRHFSSTLPEMMRIKDGIFFPMLQREALVLAFSSPKLINSQFAIKIFTGGINVLTGQSDTQNSSASAEKSQDYILAPQQGLVHGYKAYDSVKQFVAMPMGDKYTVEYQLTGKEFIGGIQLEFIPRLRDTVDFKRSPPSLDLQKQDGSSELDIFATPRQLGLYPGQRICMLDHQPHRLYEFVQGEWSQNKDMVEPEDYSRTQINRPTFVHELFDGPDFARFDPSSSLVITVLKPIQMVGQSFSDGAAAPTFYCSPLARLSDVCRFLRVRLKAMFPAETWMSWAKISLQINGKSYEHGDNTLIRDLNLTSPQKIKIEASTGSGRYGAGQGTPTASGETPTGWDMGIAMGGTIKQTIIQEDPLHILNWNWKAARTVNIQIINTVAFQAVTGLRPPVSPLSVARHFIKGIPGTPEPASIKESSLNGMIYRLQKVKSVNELDWERGAAPGVVLDGKSVVLCVCCEKNICDSV